MDKQKIAAKIKALLNKTVENGASEDEAMAAATKAHELLTKYQIEFGAVEIRTQGTVMRDTPINFTLSGMQISTKALKIKWTLASRVAEYCDCKVWGEGKNHIRVLGLPSDVEFFLWLIDSLALFAVAQMKKFMASPAYPKFDGNQSGATWHARKAFVFGCCSRINQKLHEAKPQEQNEQAKTSSGRELIVLKNQLVEEAYDKLNLNLRASRSRSYRDGSAFGAGYKAGEGASFGRPVNGNGDVKRLR